MNASAVSPRIAPALLTSLALASQPLYALEYSVDLLLASEYEDNATLTRDGRSDISNSAGLRLEAEHNTQKLQLIGDYDLRYTDYDKNTNDDRSELNGNSRVRAELAPSRLFWTLEHTLDEERRSRSQDNTADNRERRQEISTGPQILFNVTDVDALQLTAEYSEVHFSTPSDEGGDSSADSNSQSASINWQHRFSEITDFISGYSYRETERERNGAVPEREIEFQHAYVGFNRNLRELQYGVQVGGSRSQVENDDENSGLYYQADLVRQVGSSRLGLTASRQQTESSTGLLDTSQLFSDFEGGGNPFSDDLDLGNFDSEGVVEVTSYEVTYESEQYCSRCSYTVGYSYVESDYEDQGNVDNPTVDDEEQSLGVSYTHRMNSRLSATLSGSWVKTEFDDIDADQEETRGVLSLRWQANDALSLRASGGYEDRDEDVGSGYHNSFGRLEISYNLLNSAQ